MFPHKHSLMDNFSFPSRNIERTNCPEDARRTLDRTVPNKSNSQRNRPWEKMALVTIEKRQRCVAAVWGTEFIPFLPELCSCLFCTGTIWRKWWIAPGWFKEKDELHLDDLKKRMNCTWIIWMKRMKSSPNSNTVDFTQLFEPKTLLKFFLAKNCSVDATFLRRGDGSSEKFGICTSFFYTLVGPSV